MYSIKSYLLEKVRNLVNDVRVDVNRSPLKPFDYATNLLHIYKDFKEENVIDYFRNIEMVEDVKVVNRFVNIKLNRKRVFEVVLRNYFSDLWRNYDLGKGRKVLIEFVSANPTGPLNAVNGRSATFGNTLANVMKYFGYHVFKEYYVNDVGEQIEKLVDSFIERIKEARGLDFKIPEGGYEGEYLKDLARNFVDKNYSREKLKEFLIEHFVNSHRTTLERFGVVFDNWFKQSSLNNLEETIQILKDKGLIYEHDGALYFKSTLFGDDKDRVVKKTVGRVDYTYFAYDIEYIKNKFLRGFDEIITILGPDHHGYINRLLAATKALGYDNHKIIILQIVNVIEKDKLLKMSKRKGVLVLLDELMDKVNPMFLRYFFLSRLKDSPLDLDIELINRLTLDNPLYYVFYVYARINGVLNNYGKELPNFEEVLGVDIWDDEFELFLSICEFRDALLSALNDPYYLTLWAHNFAKIFHRFYNNHRIICSKELGVEREKLRLVLLLISKGVLERWGELLNIELPEKM